MLQAQNIKGQPWVYNNNIYMFQCSVNNNLKQLTGKLMKSDLSTGLTDIINTKYQHEDKFPATLIHKVGLSEIIYDEDE